MSDDKENIEQEKKNKSWWKNCWVKTQPTSWWKKLLDLKPTYNHKYIKSFLAIIMLLCALCFISKSFAFSLFEDNKIDKGHWITVDDQLTEKRNIARAHLLPDGNVLIFGGSGIAFKESTVDIFNPEKQKVIKIIPIHNENYTTSGYSSVSLKNGDVFVDYKIIKDSKNVAKIFDSKSYTFKDIKAIKEESLEQTLIPLDNGNVLLISEIPRGKPIYIYDRNKDDYFKPYGKVPIGKGFSSFFDLGNGNMILFFGKKQYLFSKNKFEEYPQIPNDHKTIQIDDENYLNLHAEYDHTIGYIYNIKENKKIPVKNKIDKTWVGNPLYPQLVLLDNKNVLILGIYAEKQKIGAKRKYNSYIYSFEKNKFFKIENPPYTIGSHTGIVKLKNGDILFAGGRTAGNGKKIQIYSYNK